MTASRLVGWIALALAVTGFAAAFGVGAAFGAGAIERDQALLFGGLAAVIGEISLWVAAGFLGFSFLAKRRERLMRLLGRRPASPSA